MLSRYHQLLNYSYSSRHHLACILLSAVLMLLEPVASQLLEFNRVLISQGQFWRLITGHVVHLNGYHLGMNVLSLWMMTLIFQEEQDLKRDLLVLVCLSVAVGILIYFFSEDIGRYVGLSGVLHGHFVYLLAIGAKRTPKLSLVAWLGTGLKVGYEQSPWHQPGTTAELIGGSVAVDAHWYGFIVGSVIATLMLIKVKYGSE